MKKEILLTIVLAIIIVILAVVALLPINKNNNQQNNNSEQRVEGIQVTMPLANAEVSSSFKISGSVNGGGWNGFEGQVGTVKLLDYKGNEIASAILTATTDWMKPPVQFETNIKITSGYKGPATLLFSNENPSGLPDKEKKFGLPVVINSSAETTTVKVYFGKNEITGSTCSVVFPVERIVPKTEAVAKTAIEELLKGPTQEEKSKGYFSSIPVGSRLNSIKIEDGTVYADFDQTTESGGGSCSMTERVSEINFTLKQFSSVKKVVISVNGKTDGIFQP